MPAIEVEDLRKSYGTVEAVRGVSFHVGEGEVFALLGPNGAGKTTTVEILEGYRTRSAGRVSVLGFDPARGDRSMKQRIGIVLQETGVEEFLTVRETIDMYRGYFPTPRGTDEIIELVELKPKQHTRITRLSGGQKRRLDVAIALAGDPDLLFLDEPTTGFDPGARRHAWRVATNLAGTRQHDAGRGGGRERRGADGSPDQVHEPRVLPKPRVGVLHDRVPADVPGDLHGPVRRDDEGAVERDPADDQDLHVLHPGHRHV